MDASPDSLLQALLTAISAFTFPRMCQVTEQGHVAIQGAMESFWILPWHRSCLTKLCCTERAKPISILFTWVQPEESSGAAKVLPGQCGIPFKVVHKNRIQGFWHVNSIEDGRVCGGARRVKEGRAFTMMGTKAASGGMQPWQSFYMDASCSLPIQVKPGGQLTQLHFLLILIKSFFSSWPALSLTKPQLSYHAPSPQNQ